MIQSSSLSGIRVQKFLNIPYAEAPVGQLRLKNLNPKDLGKVNNVSICIIICSK
jgi:carboxylesterase type B